MLMVLTTRARIAEEHWTDGSLHRTVLLKHTSCAAPVRLLSASCAPLGPSSHTIGAAKTDDALEHLDAQALANMTYGAVRSGASELPGALFELTARAAERQTREFSAHEIADTVWAFAQARRSDALLFATTAREIEERVGDFSVQNVSNIIWAFAKVDRSDRSVFRAMASVAGRIAHQFEPPELANAVWAFAKAVQFDASLFASLARTAEHSLDNLNAQEISNVAWSFATVFATATDWSHMSLFKALPVATKRCVWEMTPQQAGTILWALATAARSDASLKSAIEMVSETFTTRFNSEQLADISSALATAGNPTSDRHLQAATLPAHASSIADSASQRANAISARCWQFSTGCGPAPVSVETRALLDAMAREDIVNEPGGTLPGALADIQAGKSDPRVLPPQLQNMLPGEVLRDFGMGLPLVRKEDWPSESVDWSTRERNLFYFSAGEFNPNRMMAYQRASKSGVRKTEADGLPGRVSVLVPTMGSRFRFHEQLWKVFNALEWEDKELVVVETYIDSPSPFFTQKVSEDDRLVYVSFRRPSGQDWSIGLKRNMCTHLSSGEIVANFDDDDLYAPSYLRTMIDALQEANAAAVTLSSWHIYDVNSRKVGFVDPENMDWFAYSRKYGWRPRSMAEEKDGWLYGYGFSYVVYRKASIDFPYVDTSMSEDYCFFVELRKHRKVILYHDHAGICMHTLHPHGTAICYVTREVPKEELVKLDVAKLGPVLDEYIDSSPRRGYVESIAVI